MPPQNRSKVPIGTILEEKFRVTREIGRGGMAAVYEAENIDIGKRIAVKILAAELITSRIVRERFLREARACAAIRSPYICDVYDSGMFEERPFLVMELLEGESLYDMMTRVRRLDPETTLTIATHAARGLLRAHESNIVHRDLKPENIFLTHGEDGHLIAKLLDFGLAKFYEPTSADAETVRLTREGALFGTPAYMSPEQAKGQGEVDHRADLWALGCIVYECLTAQTVWNVDQGVAMILAQIAGAPIPRPSRLRPDLPATFDDWFLKALERNVDKRFQTAKEFADTLAEALRADSDGSALQGARAEDEGIVVDELMNRSPPVLTSARATEPGGLPLPNGARSLEGAATADGAATELEHEGSGAGRAIAVLLVLAALGLAAYGLWLYVLNPPIEQHAAFGDGGISSSAAPDGGELGSDSKPLEIEPYALQIARGQEFLAAGESKKSLAMFKEAFANGGTSVSRAFLTQIGAALENKGKCQVTGLGRPRPFELSSLVSRPTLAVSPAGAIVSWVDNHQDERRRQGFAAVLDPELRRVSPARLITPESQSVRYPQLVSAKEKLSLIYWEDAGEEPGVYVRLLEGDGRIAGAARRISSVKRSEFYPALARADDGTFWAVWEEEVEPGANDLFGRRLGTDLSPLSSEPVRLTAYLSTRSVKASAGKPDIAIAHGYLYIVYAFERGPEHAVLNLRVKLDDPVLSSGLTDDTKKRARIQDRHVGIVKPISTKYGKNTQPRVACVTEGCFVVWDDEVAGALAAFLDKDRGEAIWHREFAGKGSRPAVATYGERAEVAYYDTSRVKLAPLTRDGIGNSDSLARVSGIQPFPAIVPGARAGEWYIAWRDYEAGHLEAFVVRAQCP